MKIRSVFYPVIQLFLVLLLGMTTWANACTRTLFVTDDVVLTGRNMDWMEDMRSNLWVFPAGISRDGAAGTNSLKWISKYGSVVVSGYEAGSADGMNEKGLTANLLYLAESEYPSLNSALPSLSIAAWTQYALDNFASVNDAVAELKQEKFNVLAPNLPNGSPSALHLSLSDATGDSAIIEYIKGKLVIHHGKQFTVMTNSPSYDKQIHLNEYWEDIGGLVFLPGTNRAADRFARASFFLNAIPKQAEKSIISAVPEQRFAFQAVASVLSLQRAVSVPFGISTPDQPNIASTLWRTVADHSNLVYFFDSATSPNTFWVSLNKLDLKQGAPVKKLSLEKGAIYAGDASDKFVNAEAFKFLPAN